MNCTRFIALALVAGTVGVLHSAPVAAQAGPYQYYAVTPCRAYDTRTGAPSAGGTGGGTVSSGTVRTFRLRGLCGIPTSPGQGAAAVSLNLTIINPTATGGDLRIAPFPGTFPVVATTAYYQNETIANGAIVPLGTVTTPGVDQDFQIVGAGCGPTGICNTSYLYDLTIDVTGYFQ